MKSANTLPSLVHVCLDASAVPPEPVGAGRYTLELARALGAASDVELDLITRRSDAQRWQGLSNARLHALAPGNRVLRLVFEETLLGPLCARLGRAPALIHAPHYNAPLWSALPVVVTVHDLTMIEHPEWHEASKVAFFRRALRRAAQHARIVICPSVMTADHFADRYHPRCPVRVVPHGIDHVQFSDDEPVVGHDASVRARRGLPPQYVLHLGTIEPRKNLPGLIAAFDRLASSYPELHLVLAGQLAWGKAELERALAAAHHRDRVQLLGYVQEDDVPVLLRGATVVAYPSFAEGFGLPALEALACGAALVTSKESAMAEVAGETAFLVDPGEVDSISEGLFSAIEQFDQYRRAAGIARAAAYTWPAAARGHVDAYREALANL